MAAKPPAWIETIPADEVSGELARKYERMADPHTGKLDHILMVHSIHPRSMQDHWELYRTSMKRESGLSHAEREMIAVVVSSINACHY
jgi:alkylhydroperoxidase family enzyme